jgi:hypothetical protein
MDEIVATLLKKARSREDKELAKQEEELINAYSERIEACTTADDVAKLCMEITTAEPGEPEKRTLARQSLCEELMTYIAERDVFTAEEHMAS